MENRKFMTKKQLPSVKSALSKKYVKIYGYVGLFIGIFWIIVNFIGMFKCGWNPVGSFKSGFCSNNILVAIFYFPFIGIGMGSNWVYFLLSSKNSSDINAIFLFFTPFVLLPFITLLIGRIMGLIVSKIKFQKSITSLIFFIFGGYNNISFGS